MAETRMAALYRMVLSKHTCPFGIRAKQMLEAAGFTIDDRLLQLRKEVNVPKAEQGVATAPQMFIDGEPIDGNDDLERYLQPG